MAGACCPDTDDANEKSASRRSHQSTPYPGSLHLFDVRVRWIHQRDPHRAKSSTYLQPPLRGVASTTKHDEEAGIEGFVFVRIAHRTCCRRIRTSSATNSTSRFFLQA